MMTLPLITIYTQAYNSEKYIGRCIDSILDQTYTNFEYFICDHGSTDDTGKIIDSYASKDIRITKISFPNTARGFFPDFIKENSHGQYFVMLDSDDYVHPQYLQKLIEYTLNNKLDMTVCGVSAFFNDDMDVDDYRIFRQQPQAFHYFIDENPSYFPVIYAFLRTWWGKIINMDVLKAADFTWYKKNANVFVSDDTAFCLACYAKCRRVGSIPDALQYYRSSDESVTAKYNQKLLENNYNIYIQTLELLQQIRDTSLNSLNLAHEIWKGAIIFTFDMLLKSDLSNEEKIKEIDRIVSSRQFNVLWNDSEKMHVSEKAIAFIADITKGPANLSAETYAEISHIATILQSNSSLSLITDLPRVLIWKGIDDISTLIDTGKKYKLKIAGIICPEIREPMMCTPDGLMLFDIESGKMLINSHQIDRIVVDSNEIAIVAMLYGYFSNSLLVMDNQKNSQESLTTYDNRYSTMGKAVIYGTDYNSLQMGAALQTSNSRNEVEIDGKKTVIIGNIDTSMTEGACLRNGNLFFSLKEAGSLFEKKQIDYVLIPRESIKGEPTLDDMKKAGIILDKVYSYSLLDIDKAFKTPEKWEMDRITYDD